MNKCPKCSNSFAEKTKFCKICGCNLQEELIENPTCPKCNSVFSSDIKYCIQDGTKLVHPDKLIPKCSICKKSYTNGAKFCPDDGGQIKLDDEIIQKIAPITAPPVYEPIKSTDQETAFYSRPIENQYVRNEKYNKASLGKRFLAYLLDGLVVLLFCIPSIILIFDTFLDLYNYGFDSLYDYGSSKFVWGLILLLVPIIYGLIKDGLGNGQSYGKRAVDLMVINVNSNKPCSKTNSVGRNIIFNLVQLIPYVGWIIEYVMVFANPEGRKISDLVAGTQVIDVNEYKNN